MTVSTTTNTVVYLGNGSATSFAVPFTVLDVDHLLVWSREADGGALVETYTGTDFTYTGIGDPSGTLELDGPALSSDYELVIVRTVPYTQELDIVNVGGFYPATVEEQLDLIVMQIQQLADMAVRAVKSAVGTSQDSIEFTPGSYLIIDANGQVGLGTGTGADSALREDLAAPTGGTLVGIVGVGSVQDFYDSVTSITDFGVNSIGIGSAALSARLTVQTDTTFEGNGVHIYHYAQQTDPANQTSATAIHNYTDGVSTIIDTVGSGYGLRIKQANNAAARADKPAGYIGDGAFLELQRSKLSGALPWPNGNISGNNDRLTFFNEHGNLCFYGSDAGDWDGTDTTAPIQIGTYENFLNQKLYMGYNFDLDKAVIGSINSTLGAFTYIDFACLGLRPIGDNAVTLGAASLRFTYVHAFNVRTHEVTVATLPSAVTSGAGTRAFVSDSNAAAAGNFGAIVAGGGANKVPVYSDGNDWRIG